MVSYIFGGRTGKTQSDIQRERDYAESLLAQAGNGVPRNEWEGIAAIGKALSGQMALRKVRKEEAAARTGAASKISGIAAALNPIFPEAPTPRSSSGVVDALNPKQTANAAEHERDPSIPGLQIKGGIEETAKSLGIDPVDLATAISYETGGTFDPTKAGPTTKWGQHRGLIQFGEPQAKQYGVDWNNPVGSQLGPDGAVAKYLRDTGVKPGMGMLDIYSAINAGGVGRYGASDAAAGGAPGTVADKVNSQMAGHRAKALAMFGGGQPATPAAAPVQVASLDPSAGIAQATRPMPEEYAKTGLSQEAWARMNAPNGAVPPAQPTVTAALNRQDINPQAAGQPIATDAPTQRVLGQMMQPQSMTGGAPMPIQGQPQQVAQAQPQDLSQIPVMAGGTSGAFQPGQGGPSMEMLIDAMNDPNLNDQQRAFVGNLIEQKMQQSDPLRQLQLQKLQQDVNSKPERKTVTINGRLVDASTGQEIANFPEEPKKPSAVQEYEYAKTQGFPGTFQDWEASKKGGMSLTVDPATGQVSFQQGNNIKPMTEGQSKDTTYAVRAEGALPLIDKFGDALTSLPESAAGSLPGGVGNYLQSPEYQQAEQAGKEFLQAILRKDTGAAITKEETDEYGSVYLPRPGDSAEVLAQKKVSRARALEALKAGMTPQAILAQEKALEKTTSSAPTDGVARPTTDDEYNALPTGTEFIAPDGSRRRKP